MLRTESPGAPPESPDDEPLTGTLQSRQQVTVKVSGPPHEGIRPLSRLSIHRINIIKMHGVNSVLFGEGGRLHNAFHYRLRRARVPIERLQDGRPALRRALECLVREPDNPLANRIYRNCLASSHRQSRPNGHYADINRAQTINFRAYLRTSRDVTISRARSVVIGDSAAVHNDFHYRAWQGKIPIERLVAENPVMAQTFARMVASPTTPSIRRLFCRQVAHEITHGSPLELLSGIRFSPREAPATLDLGGRAATIRNAELAAIGNPVDFDTSMDIRLHGVKIDGFRAVTKILDLESSFEAGPSESGSKIAFHASNTDADGDYSSVPSVDMEPRRTNRRHGPGLGWL